MTTTPHPTQTPQTNNQLIDDILSALKTGRSFFLSGHQNPDGDVIGSELGMASLIGRLNPKARVDIQNYGPVPRALSFLPRIETVKNIQRAEGVYDAVIVFECSGADRMGNIIDFQTQAKQVINIDHHLHNPNYGDINFVEPHTSSTSELIYKIFERSGLLLTKEEATCLYTGIVADTGWFRYGNTNAQTHQIAGKMLEAGVAVDTLSERFYLSRSKAALQLISWVLSHMKLYYDDRVALLKIPEQVMRDLGATADDIEEIVNYGLQVESVCASILLKEKTDPPQVKVSLRSKGSWDINKIARAFGGGGHRNASGCSLSNNLDEAEAIMVKEAATLFS